MKYKNLLLASLSILLFSCNNQNQRFNVDVEVPVSVQEIEKDNIQEVFTATGTIQSEYAITIQSEAQGDYYLQINPRTGKKYKMGDVVKQGDLIISIKNLEYENDVNIEGAKIDLDISKMEYEKQVALYEKGGATMREKVNAHKTLVTAEKTYQNAELNLAKLSVIASFNGVITDLPYYSQGVKINQGEDVLQIMSYQQMIMDLMLPESQIGKVSLNQEALITNYSLPEDTLKGFLREISPAIDEDSRTFKGRVYIKNGDMKLRPGMFVKADVIVDRKDSVIVIPKDAILFRDNGKAVFIARGDQAHERIITTGMENEGKVEVIEGLNEEERLIIKGFETLKHRSKIKILNK